MCLSNHHPIKILCPRHRLAKLVAALHCRLRRQIGIDVDRQHRIGVADVGQRNADGVVDLRRAGEGRIEVLSIKLADDFETDFAWHLPMKLPAGEFAGRLAAHMNRKGWRSVVEELFGMIVGEDNQNSY